MQNSETKTTAISTYCVAPGTEQIYGKIKKSCASARSVSEVDIPPAKPGCNTRLLLAVSREWHRKQIDYVTIRRKRRDCFCAAFCNLTQAQTFSR